MSTTNNDHDIAEGIECIDGIRNILPKFNVALRKCKAELRAARDPGVMTLNLFDVLRRLTEALEALEAASK